MGHLLFLLGEVSDKVMNKYERESQKMGKSSFKFAWALDETAEERERLVCHFNLISMLCPLVCLIQLSLTHTEELPWTWPPGSSRLLTVALRC